MKVDIFVLNYNGEPLLRECLPSIYAAAQESIYKPSLTIIDNKSTDNSREYVKGGFPDILFKEMKENRGLCSLNEAGRESDADVVLFLNNDLTADIKFIDPLIGVFIKRKDAFLAAPCCYSFDGSRIDVSSSIPVFKWGILKGLPAPGGEQIKGIAYTLQAGFGAFDRKRFIELDGYDEMYLPGIIEDTDLCFRAWRKGYVSYYQPDSKVYHMGKATFRKEFGNRRLLALSHRNSYLFAWKHIHSACTFLKHILYIPLRLTYSVLSLKFEIIWGFFWSLKKLPEALSRRNREVRISYPLGFKDVLNIFSDNKWEDFYKTGFGTDEFLHNIDIHKYFLNQILKTKPKSAIEIGSGSGTMPIFLSSQINRLVSVDNNEKVLDMAKENNNRFNGQVEFIKDDAFNLSFSDKSFDVAFSQGFFEHFSDMDIRRLIKEQLRIAREVIFSVPTVHYRNKDFGNERLMTKGMWRTILKGFNITEDSYYLYIRRKKNFFLKLPMMYMARIGR